jgi:hypothetical protein
VGRKKKERPVMTKAEHDAKDKVNQAQKDLVKREEELKLYSDGQPYDKVRVIGETKFYLTETATSIFEAGRRIFWMKEKESHGEFEKIVNDELGLSRVTAWRLMAIARKLANVSRVKQLSIHSLKSGVGKLYAMLDVPDEDLKLFEDSGSFLGKSADEIDQMSVKDLRDMVRGHRDRKKTWDQKLKNKDEKIIELQNELFGQKIGFSEEEEKEFEKLKGMKDVFNNLWHRLDTADLSKASDRMVTEFLGVCEYMHDLSKLLYLRQDNRFNRMDSQRAAEGEVTAQEVKVIKKYPQIYAGTAGDAGGTGAHAGAPLQGKTAGEGTPS